MRSLLINDDNDTIELLAIALAANTF